MKLSFTTRGWQSLSWDELLATVSECGLNGFELYDIHKRTDLTGRGAPLDKYHISATVRQLREREIRIPCLDSSLDLSLPETDLSLPEQLIDLAGSLRVPYVSAVALTENEPLVLSALEKLLPAAEKIETTPGSSLVILAIGACTLPKRLRKRVIVPNVISPFAICHEA